MIAKLEQLREQFLRCDSQAMVEAACVQGGLIIKESFDSGESFGFEDLSELLQADYLQLDHEIFLNEFKLASAFKFFASGASQDPNVLSCRVVSRSNGVTLGQSKPNSHAEQSERYAAFCLELIEMMGKEPESPGDALHKKALLEWNAGTTWKNISEKLTGEPESWKSFSQAVKRYAKRMSLAIRTGSPGTKSNRNE